MMVSEFPHGLDLAKATAGYVRSGGVHASDLYGAFYRAHDPKRYDRKGEDGEPLPFDLAKMELGTSFEEVLEPILAQRLLGERPGEFTSPEGVIFSPDYIFNIDDELVLGEFKLTWYSSRGALMDPKFARYWSQVKLYCHWLQITRARVYVFFVNGDYKPPSPVLRAWEAKFSKRELQDEFDVIARHARKKGLLKAA